ncbi:UNVERIFIED_CONTAM: hypothetical protein GTU68_051687, partial [Idotea baltica]|nr:hypothetical protein [Idotea baltica]
EAYAIHGISDEDLADKPLFEDVAKAFADFIAGDMLVIHNARFDVKFLNFELSRADLSQIRMDRVTDTLDMARNRFPGAQNSLDALCRRFRVDSSKRVKHGALLDSELLADVYIELIGGRQGGFSLDVAKNRSVSDGAESEDQPAKARGGPRPVLLTDAEKAAHADFLQTFGKTARWIEDDAPAAG